MQVRLTTARLQEDRKTDCETSLWIALVSLLIHDATTHLNTGCRCTRSHSLRDVPGAVAEVKRDRPRDLVVLWTVMFGRPTLAEPLQRMLYKCEAKTGGGRIDGRGDLTEYPPDASGGNCFCKSDKALFGSKLSTGAILASIQPRSRRSRIKVREATDLSVDPGRSWYSRVLRISSPPTSAPPSPRYAIQLTLTLQGKERKKRAPSARYINYSAA